MLGTLGELVSKALQDAEMHSKTASAVQEAPPDFTDDLLSTELGLVTPEEPTKVASSSAPAAAPPSNPMDTAAYGMKVAEALKLVASTLEKRAEDVKRLESQFEGATTQHPKPPAMAAKPLPSTKVGPQTTDLHEKPKTATALPKEKIAADKVATKRLLDAKIAEYKIYTSMGNTEAAKQAEAQIKELQTKVAETLETTGGEPRGSHIPDNQGLINMTKAQAKDSTVRDGAKFVEESPKKDNAVAANSLSDNGLKISSLRELLADHQKEAGVGGDILPGAGAAIEDRMSGHAGSSFMRSYLGGTAGSLAGAAPGYTAAALLHKKHPNAALAALGAGVVGSLAGAAYGGHKGQESARKAHAAKKGDK